MKHLLLTTIAAVVLVGCGNTEADRALLKAVSVENIDAIKDAIANGANINTKDKGGATPLDYTLIKNNRLNYLQIPKNNKTNILNHNISDLIRRHGGESGAPDSLAVAALVGDISWVSKHLNDGINVNQNIDNKFTPLLVAAKEGHIKIVELLIAQGADVNLKLPILGAIKHNQIGIVETLIAKGANINLKDNSGRTPLHRAASLDRREIAGLLIANGADVNAKDNYTSTPLYAAAGWGHKEVAALLIAEGANVNAIRRSGGAPTPLDAAESVSQSYSPELKAALNETAALLRKHGGKTSNWLKAAESIHMAAKAGHIEAVKKHLAAGTDVNVKYEMGTTTLHDAAFSGHKETVELLIAKGADVNVKNDFGQTPLDWAISRKYPEIAKLLRKHGGKTGKELKAEGK